MTKTPEGKVKDKIRAALIEHGAYFVTPIASRYSRAGVPDFIVGIAGRFVGIEAKAAGGKCTRIQLHEHSKIEAAGCEVLVIGPEDIPRLRDALAAAKAKAD